MTYASTNAALYRAADRAARTVERERRLTAKAASRMWSILRALHRSGWDPKTPKSVTWGHDTAGYPKVVIAWPRFLLGVSVKEIETWSALSKPGKGMFATYRGVRDLRVFMWRIREIS